MKAQFVYESISFERGLNPKKTMGIGQWYREELKEAMKDLVKKYGGYYRIRTVNDEYTPYIRASYFNPLFRNGESRIIRYYPQDDEWYLTYGRASGMWLRDSLESALSDIEDYLEP